jgi:hypothetical protein
VSVYVVDLGSSRARAGWLADDGRLTVAGGADGLPVAVWPAAGDDLRVGRQALERAVEHPGEVVFSVLDRLAAPEGPDARGFGHSAVRLATRVLAGIAEAVDRERSSSGGGDRDVVLSLPMTGDLDIALRRAAEGAGLRVRQTLADAAAVVLGYRAAADGTPRTLAVHDQGGAWLTSTVLAVSDRTFRVLRSVREPLGGRLWDDTIARDLFELPDGAPVAPRWRMVAERLRRALDDGTAGHATETVTVGERGYEVRLDRDRLETLLAAPRARALDATERVLASLDAPPDAVLLAGGACAAPGMAELVAERLGDRAPVLAERPEWAVLRGLVAARDFGLVRVVPMGVPDRPAPRRALPPSGGGTAGPGRPAGTPPWAAATGPAPRGRTGAASGEVPWARTGATASAGTGSPWDAPEATGAPGGSSASGDPGPDAPSGPAASGTFTENVFSGPLDPGEPRVIPRRGPLAPVPVTGLTAERRGDRLLVVWEWPPDALTAVVRWTLDARRPGDGLPGGGEVRCSRRGYEHDGGLELPVGAHGVTLTAAAYAPAPEGAGPEPPSTLEVPARRPVVRYEPVVRRTLTGRREWRATITFTGETACRLPELCVVQALGRYRPASTAEGTVVHRLPAQRVEPDRPLVVRFALPAPRGESWLVCFPVDPDPEVDLRPSALHRLKVT